MYSRTKVFLTKWFSGKREKDKGYAMNHCFFRSSDDEGSEEEGEGDEEDEYEYDEEEDNDEDYEDEEEEEEEDEDAESPSFFFGKNPIQQQAWNNFQFGAPKTSSAQQESVGDLSSMIENFNVCSPFNFGLKSTIEV
jgi:hypothetical protein